MSKMAKVSLSNKDLDNGNCPKRQTFLQAKASYINKNLDNGKCPKWQMVL